MKPLFWRRVLAPPADGPADNKENAGGFWSTVEEASIDTGKLEELFGADSAGKGKKKPSAGGAGGAGGSAAAEEKAAPKFISILDGKRSNAISFMLARLPPIDGLITALTDLDGDVISRDSLRALVENAPTAEEVAAIRDAATGDVPLDKPEAFCLALVDAIPNAKEMLACWAFMRSFSERDDELGDKIGCVRASVAAVRESRALRSVFGTLLAMGNYMNGGTKRGQADGFDLSILPKLADTKDVAGSGTLFDHLVAFCRDASPELKTQLCDEMAALEEACRVSLSDTQGEINRLAADINTVASDMDAVVAGGCGAAFTSQLPPFVESAKSRVAEFNEDAVAVAAAFRDLVGYLGFAKNKVASATSEEVFGVLWEFVREFSSRWEAAAHAEAEAERRSRVGGKIGGVGEGDAMAALANAIKLGKPTARRRGSTAGPMMGINPADILNSRVNQKRSLGERNQSSSTLDIEARLEAARKRRAEQASGEGGTEETPLQQKLRLARERNNKLSADVSIRRRNSSLRKDKDGERPRAGSSGSQGGQ